MKRILSKEFDIFLADSRISRLAISHLGKEFYKRRKVPLCVNVEKDAKSQTSNLSVQIEKLSKSTQVIMTSRGANINIPFAHSLMSEEDQFDNLKSLVSQLNDCIPRGFKNIKVISLQVTPLYNSYKVGWVFPNRESRWSFESNDLTRIPHEATFLLIGYILNSQ